MEVYAYLNHGRWIVDCPKCGKLGSTLAEPNPNIAHYSAINGKFICPNCYPGMVVIKSRGVISVRFNEDARAAAKKHAEGRQEIYDVVFPKERKEIEGIVSLRRLDQQNWQPGETVEFLKEENELIGAK